MSMYGDTKTEILCGPGVTKQSMKDETDINNIMKRYKAGGMISHVQNRSPVYMDVSQIVDYRTAIEQVRATEEFFQGLPATVRREFEDDAAAFLDFVSNPANKQTAEEMGVIPKPPEPEVVPAVP